MPGGGLAAGLGLIAWSADVDGLTAEAYRDTAGPGTDGMKALTELAKSEATTPIGRRNWALVALIYSAGLRRSEAAALSVGDLDLPACRARILGKGRFQTEWVPMSKPAADAITEWLTTRGELPPEAPLFVRLDSSKPGTDRLTDDGIHHILSQLGKRAGLKRPLAPHQLRHAAITRLSERTGGDLVRVQAFSRHKKLETVRVYVDNAKDKASALSNLLGEDL